MIGGLRVVLRDDLLRETRHAADGLIREVERRLLLALEARRRIPSPVCPVSVVTTAKPRTSAGVVPAACAPSGNATLPFRPPPPC